MRKNEEIIFTYGEAYIMAKMAMQMVNGEWVAIQVPQHLPRMSKEQALQYYSEKFNTYWKEKYNKFCSKNGVRA